MKLSVSERLLSLSADIKPGESSKVFSLFYMLFMLLLTAYILKPVREELILMEGGSELKSYTTAFQAIFLLGFVPIYSYFSQHFSAKTFMLLVGCSCILLFIGFAAAGAIGIKIGIVFYIWIGAYGVLVVSQFWAYASEFYQEEDGKRLFGIIALGASMGAFIGSYISTLIPNTVSPYLLLLIGSATLFLSILPVFFISQPEPCKTPQKQIKFQWLSVYKLVLNSRYMLTIALFVLVINWVNSLGEYLISYMVEVTYDKQVVEGSIEVSKNSFIRSFYSDFYFIVNITSMFIQFFLVSRFIQYFGVKFALLVIPSLIFLGYSLLIFIPVIALFKLFKIVENSLDYSLLNTVKQILFLPTTRREKYEARAFIESIGTRFGDILQGITVFIGLNLLDILPHQFLFVMVFSALLLIYLALVIAKLNKKLTCQSND